MTPDERRAWRDGVLGHSGLTTAQRVVLLALETFADYPGGENAHPGVARLAEKCALGTRVVDTALQRGRELGLIEQTERANPRRGRASCYRLLSIRTVVRVEDDSIRSTVRIEPDSTRTDVRIEREFYPHERDFNPHGRAVSTRTSVRATNPLTPILDTKESSRQPGTSPGAPHPKTLTPDRQPTANGKPARGPRCARHAHIVDDDKVPACPDCRDVKDALKASRAEQREATKRRIRDAIDRCDDCDDYGRLHSDMTDCPRHPNFRQTA